MRDVWTEENSARLEDSISYEQLASIERHDYTKTNFYQMCMRGDTVNWTTPYLDREGAKCVVVSYVMPLHDPKGDFVGGMGVDVSIDWLNNIINQRHFYPSSYNLFLSPTGELIVSPDEDSVNSEKGKGSEFIVELPCRISGPSPIGRSCWYATTMKCTATSSACESTSCCSRC